MHTNITTEVGDRLYGKTGTDLVVAVVAVVLLLI